MCTFDFVPEPILYVIQAILLPLISFYTAFIW